MSSSVEPAAGWLHRQWLQFARLLNHDFLPRYNGWLYWIKRPVWALTLALGMALLMGAAVNTRVLLAAAVMAVLLVVGAAWPWLTMRGVHCTIRFTQPRARVGGSVEAIVSVINRWPWPVWGLTLERGFGDETGLALARVDGWSRSDFTWRFTPRTRGVYPHATPWLETGFPLGLCRARSQVAVHGNLLVWPESRALRTLPDAAANDSLDDQLSDHRSGEFGDLLGTRNFAAGDSLRRVHWAQTARYQRLIVCERQAGAVAVFQVVLDLVAGHYASADDFETAVSVFVSVCESLQREHAQVEARLGTQVFQLGQHRDSLRRLCDAVARLPAWGATNAGHRPMLLQSFDGVVVIVVSGSRRPHSQRLPTSPTRVIAVGPECETNSGHSWLSITAQRLDDLPQRWRRGCHVN